VDARCPQDGTLLVVDASMSATELSPSRTWPVQQPAVAEPRPAPDGELPPGACVGEYVIERKIGVGGMGVVYGARHPVIGKRAAIKLLNAKHSVDQESLSRFVLEAQAVNRIAHANIVDIFSFGTLDDGRSYFAMEWLQGETLGERLRRGRLSSREVVAILSTLCRALEAAHAAGVIHRDLKPDNVFLATDDDGWRVKLLDFGIAKLSTASSSTRTETGVAIGTPLYMAPEQARGEAVDGQTDVYALGLLAYTAVCGVSLFQDEGSAVETLAAHIIKPPPSPRVHVPDLSVGFEALILDMVAKEPGQRPALIEVRQRLATIAAALTDPAPPAGQVTERVSAVGMPPSRPPLMPSDAPTVVPVTPIARAPSEADLDVVPRRSRWPLVVTAVAIPVVVAALVIAVRRHGAPPPPAEPRLAVTAPPATVAAVEVTPPAPPDAAAEVTAPAPITAELTVEPGLAHLVIDGRPVDLVDGRAALALSPGNHVAIATVGARSTRKRFAVTADRRATVSLRVPAADPHADPHAGPAKPPPTGVDVDAVQNPFSP
jgi:serine/threonine protein kinase